MDRDVISEEEINHAIQEQSPSDSECHVSGELTVVRDNVPSNLVNAKVSVCSYIYLLKARPFCATRYSVMKVLPNMHNRFLFMK